MAMAINDPATANDPAAAQDVEWAARLDGFVERARKASLALRELDQEAVDRIVWAMTVAGLEHAVELAELAMEETHSACSRTRWSRTTSPPSSSTTT